MSSLPTVVFVCDLFTLCYAMSAIFNTVSLHSTAFDHCTVCYGTCRVGRYGYLYTYLNTGDLQLSEHAAIPFWHVTQAGQEDSGSR